jgi:hypothetical protein
VSRAAPKPPFSAMPLRWHRDPRFTFTHAKALSIISYHDRMSLVTGKGQGCWASNQTMADEIEVNLTNMSTAINQLAKWGYIEISRKKTEKSRRVCRVIYVDDEAPEYALDDLPIGKAGVLPTGKSMEVNQLDDDLPSDKLPAKVLCPGPSSNPQKTANPALQDIPLRVVRYPAEAAEEIQHKLRDFPNRALPDDESDGAVSAQIERFWRAGERRPEVLATWMISLDRICAKEGSSPNDHRARRLFDEIATYCGDAAELAAADAPASSAPPQDDHEDRLDKEHHDAAAYIVPDPSDKFRARIVATWKETTDLNSRKILAKKGCISIDKLDRYCRGIGNLPPETTAALRDACVNGRRY